MIRAHRIRLNPTPEQIAYFIRAAGVRRFVYNWGLAEWQRQHQAGEKPSAAKLKKQFNAIKRDQYPWVYEVSKSVAEGAFIDLRTAFQNFVAGRARRPRFKTKKHNRDGFYLANDRFTFSDHWIALPHIGKVNMAEKLRFKGKILAARITRSADWWFVSVIVELLTPDPEPHSGPAVGIDLGVNCLMALSDGTRRENQAPLKSVLQKVKRIHRSLSRKQRNSQNWYKTKRKLARLHYRVACVRNDRFKKLAAELTSQYAFIGLEDLNVKGMFKNRRLALALSDAAWGQLTSLLEHKAQETGTVIVKVGRFFPSSKQCHDCGYIHRDLTLSDRVYACPNCGLTCDRDLNASINILQEALRIHQHPAVAAVATTRR